jgi:cytidyltransferase-like protein
LFHHGHVLFLKKASELGDYLMVGVCSDEAVSLYKRPPVMKLSERLTVISSCRYVDQVIPAAPPDTTKEFITEHRIDLVVATQAYSTATLDRYYKDPKELGILKLASYAEGISTTDLIKRCNELYVRLEGSLGKL